MSNRSASALVCAALLAFGLGAGAAQAEGNTKYDSFAKVKKILEHQVYQDHRVTLYCLASYDRDKNITLPKGFTTPEHEKRARRVEWEHVVPAENFGRFFKEWREGAPGCTDSKGRSFKGRKCAEKENMTFRYMQADMYNLYPAIGAVNAIRSNYNYQMLPGEKAAFGTCPMKIADRHAEPPAYARGEIARTTLYMADAYKDVYKLSSQQRKLMEAWSREDPVDKWECTRAKRIEKLQGNTNKFVAEACRKAGF